MIFSKKGNKISKCFYDHNEDVAECLQNTEKFFTVLFSDDPDEHLLESVKVSVDNCEDAADIALRRTVDQLGESFLPTTRSNLISIAQSTDCIANRCQSIVRQVFLEKIHLPAELHHDVMEVISITRGQLTILYTAIDKLLNDFAGLAKDKKVLDDVRMEESRVDSIEDMLHARIFTLDLSLCEKIYYKDVVKNICNLSDTIEDISDQIQVMLVEREA